MSDSTVRQGQQFNQHDDFVIRFSEQDCDLGTAGTFLDDARTEVIPTDRGASKVRVFTAPTAQLDAFHASFIGSTNLSLPDVLTEILFTYNKAGTDASHIISAGTAVAGGTSGSLTFNPNATAQASASIMPDAQPLITSYWGRNIPSIHHFVYLPENSAATAVLTKLQTVLTVATTGIVAGVVSVTAHGFSVNQPFRFATLVGGAGGIAVATTYYVRAAPPTNTFTYSATAGGAALAGHSATSGTLFPVVQRLPVFKPQTMVVTLNGQQVSLSQSAESHEQVNWSPSGYNYSFNTGVGQSIESGVTVRTVVVSPTLHGAFSLSGLSDDKPVTTTVKANIPAISGTILGAITNEPSPITATALSSISVTNVGATSPTGIPTAGLYIVDVNSTLYDWGYQLLHVEVVDMSIFA